MRYLLKMYRSLLDPIDEVAISAADDEEALGLAQLHVLMAQGVTFAAAERDGRECFRVDHEGHASTL